MYTAAVIPVRNRPALVVDAIMSIQQQTWPVDEIIVVHDGSTDDTPDVISRLAKQDRRIRLFRLPRSGGASAARNVGINASQCKYICFLDSEDQWLPNKIELQLRLLKSAPEAVASFAGLRHQWPGREHDVNPPIEITLKKLRKRTYLGSTSTAIVRRDIMLQVGAFDSSLPSCQDWDLWIRLRRVGEFSIVPQPLTVFNQAGSSRISKDRDSVLAGHSRVFNKILEDVPDRKERRVIAAYHQCG